jgi:hypothetical protein
MKLDLLGSLYVFMLAGFISDPPRFAPAAYALDVANQRAGCHRGGRCNYFGRRT